MLHVTESFGAGVANAICDYVDRTSELLHSLAMLPRREVVSRSELGRFEAVYRLRRGPSTIPELRRVVRTEAPDVIHAHSSWAGLAVRILPGLRSAHRIVYTPHCFAFERTDAPLLAISSRAVEKVLAPRCDVLAACSDREASLGLQMGIRRVVHVPNVARHTGGAPSTWGLNERLVASGRLTNQKDPKFLADVVRHLHAESHAVGVEWIGDGDPQYRRMLESVGVAVSGWLDRTAASHRLASGTVFVHTAAWEGFPLVLQEAHRRGLAIIVRSIPAFDQVPKSAKASTPAEMALKLDYLLASREARDSNRTLWRQFFRSHTEGHQRSALLEAYGTEQ